ncbi:hexitol phosphatase HxpB [Photobacterium aphoticum]|uniref:2-deoxyglucose-6-phosphatase n=1 Tax=Photobacterium aphoticum TaxID=754436 RepID=A0A0J1GGB6_9GAMM|nr:hexitol phosphatase HxpB [Photobacterium aphoticum]KLU98625.1 2-deoxyglucose-6-phosphatase [Photobacterium aphoticum]PSU57547.1 hexitol phosphatase HxpB [Photobacterium aphoticum]GHA62690.1 2-deoxyglucose-6-phosphate phosphatase [Photobacterium aphoticum]
MLQAAVFDMDGLLVDSEPFWQRAQVDIFSSLGVQITLQDTLQTMGLRIDHVVAFWYSKQPWEGHDIPTVTEMIVSRVEALIREHKPMLPGVIEAIETCHEYGLKVALASSSPMRLIQSTLEALSLTDKFAAVLSAEPLRFGKPHPEVYINAADALGVPPNACVAFEDSVNGLLAAKAAQMKGIAVPEHAYSNDPRWAIADRKLNSLLEVNATLLDSLR